MPVLITCKFDKEPTEGDWENAGKTETSFCPLYVNESFLLIQSAAKTNAAFPHPKDATDKIWQKLANWSWRYNCSEVWTTTTDDRALLYCKLTLWAFDSGQLTKERLNSDVYLFAFQQCPIFPGNTVDL